MRRPLLITGEFSLSMLDAPDGASLTVRPMRPSDARQLIEDVRGEVRVIAPDSYKTEKLHGALGILPIRGHRIGIGDRVLVIENPGWHSQRAFLVDVIADADGCVPDEPDPFED